MKVKRRAFSRAFTLVEVLVATAILAFMLVVLTSFLSGVSRAWTAGEQQTSKFQDGRAILELIGRELSQAAISPTLQFVHDPSLNNTPQRANTDCLFWQAPIDTGANGRLAEVGYYLSENFGNTGSDVYQLKRFYVSPTDAANYQIFTPPNQPTDKSAPWVSQFVTNPQLSTIVASGVLAFWVRCLDRNGNPVPWVPGNAGLRFNSAAHFQVPTADPTSSFRYTNTTSTVQAHRLPTFVELTLVTLDPTSFKRSPKIPPLVAQNNENDLPTVRDSFNSALIANNVRTARTFTTIVRLVNSQD